MKKTWSKISRGTVLSRILLGLLCRGPSRRPEQNSRFVSWEKTHKNSFLLRIRPRSRRSIDCSSFFIRRERFLQLQKWKSSSPQFCFLTLGKVYQKIRKDLNLFDFEAQKKEIIKHETSNLRWKSSNFFKYVAIDRQRWWVTNGANVFCFLSSLPLSPHGSVWVLTAISLLRN